LEKLNLPKMKKITSLVTLSLLGVSSTLMGAWTALETFEGSVDLQYDSQKLKSGEITTSYGVLQVIADPADSNNLIGAFSAGPAEGDNYLNDSLWWADLPEPVAADSTAATFYLRVYAPTTNFDAGWAVSYTDQLVTFWNDYEALMRITASTFVDVRNGGSYEPIAAVQTNDWYEYWIVMNNLNNTYQVYARGGHFGTDQVLVETVSFNNEFAFRVGTDETLKRFVLNFSTGSYTGPNGRDPIYIDDLYYDGSGVNLSTATPPPPAGWVSLEDFEGTVGLDYESQKLKSGEITTQYGVLNVIQDPADATNLVGSFSAGPAEGDNYLNDSVWWAPLPDPVAADSTASTFYLEVYAPTTNFDAGWAVSYTDDLVTFWNDYEALMRITASTFVDVRNGGSYEPIAAVQTNAWYQYWIVMNNLANTYQVYAQGGHFGMDQVLVETVSFNDEFAFRVGTDETLKRLVLNFSTGSDTGPNGRDPIYIDNLYYYPSGMNLDVPDSGVAPEMWGPYEVQTNGTVKWVDTGAWLGTLEVTSAMNDSVEWVYSFKLSKWVWIPRDTVSLSSGSWLYVRR